MAKQRSWVNQQAVFKETREKEKTRKEALGKLFHDFSKLSFAGLVIGGITPIYTDVYYGGNFPYVVFGVMATLLFAIVGNYIYKK